MTNIHESPHRKHRPYQRSKAKANASALIDSARSAIDDDAPFDPAIPGEDVGGGDPGLAYLLARPADEIEAPVR